VIYVIQRLSASAASVDARRRRRRRGRGRRQRGVKPGNQGHREMKAAGIEFREVTKRYDAIVAVREVSFAIEPGRSSPCSVPRAAARPRSCA